MGMSYWGAYLNPQKAKGLKPNIGGRNLIRQGRFLSISVFGRMSGGVASGEGRENMKKELETKESLVFSYLALRKAIGILRRRAPLRVVFGGIDILSDRHPDLS